MRKQILQPIKKYPSKVLEVIASASRPTEAFYKVYSLQMPQPSNKTKEKMRKMVRRKYNLKFHKKKWENLLPSEKFMFILDEMKELGMKYSEENGTSEKTKKMLAEAAAVAMAHFYSEMDTFNQRIDKENEIYYSNLATDKSDRERYDEFKQLVQTELADNTIYFHPINVKIKVPTIERIRMLNL